MPDRSEDGLDASCFGRTVHLWGKPAKSDTYGCTVKSCARCGRVAKVSGREVER